jgi:hypothetical protein
LLSMIKDRQRASQQLLFSVDLRCMSPSDNVGSPRLNDCYSLLCLANFVFLLVYSIRARRETLRAGNSERPADANFKVEQGTELTQQP